MSIPKDLRNVKETESTEKFECLELCIQLFNRAVKSTETEFSSNTTVVYTANINNLGIQSGRIFVEVEGGFISNLALEKGKPYQLKISEMSNQSDLNFIATFEDYTFTASGTDYVDGEGVHHSGIAVLNNRLQFFIISTL